MDQQVHPGTEEFDKPLNILSEVEDSVWCFLHMSKVIDSVERGNLRYTKSILGLSNQVNNDRLRIILNRPLDRISVGTNEEEHEEV